MSRFDIANCCVCVVGGTGFLGSHLVDYLIQVRGCKVIVVDNMVSGHRKYLKLNENCQLINEDISKMSVHDWLTIFEFHEVRFIFNYAAEPYIPECFNRPAHFFRVNALAVMTLLDAVEASHTVDAMLQVSSAELYGSATGIVDENQPIEPHSTYGVAKAAADGLVQVRWREAKVPAIALRQFNCVGERETHEYVIPEIISQLHESSNIKLGNNSTRDFLYAGDAVAMAVELLECGEFGEVYNLGSERAVTIYSLAHLIARVMLKNVNIEMDESRKRPWEIWHLQSDNTKIYNVIKRRPRVNLEDALQRTVYYFKSNGYKWDYPNSK